MSLTDLLYRLGATLELAFALLLGDQPYVECLASPQLHIALRLGSVAQ
jgi:hypothetical protein